jgi:hypothetical protein
VLVLLVLASSLIARKTGVFVVGLSCSTSTSTTRVGVLVTKLQRPWTVVVRS